MVKIRVFSVPASPFLGSVLLALEERHAEYEFMPLGLGDQRREPHLTRQPFGRMSAMEHDGFALYETQAILRYLAEVFPGESLIPETVQGRARMNQLMGINDCYFFPKVSAVLVWERLVKPRVAVQPSDEAAIESSKPIAETCVRAIEKLMAGQKYLVGDRLSLADLHLAPQLYYFAMTPEGARILEQHPSVAQWVERMKQRPSMKKTGLWGVSS
jgi:glutathione S-transferase